MIEYKLIVSNDSALPLLGKEWWELICIDSGKMYLSREIKKTRKEKKAEMTQEYLQFKELFPKKTGITSQKVINKIDEIVKSWDFEKLMEWVEKFNKKIFLEKILPKFIPYPETFLNQRRWEDEFQIMENRLVVSEQWITEYLKQLTPQEWEKLLEMKRNYKKDVTRGVIENMIRKMKWIED